MNDRELLELAAKAAGISGHWVGRFAADGYPADFVGIGRDSATIAPLWNPLTDDGDALRLAVKLMIGVHHEPDSVDVSCYYPNQIFLKDDFGLHPEEGRTREEVTRRLIVRAAAAFGRAMP